jgi:hypothetical protein
MKLLALTLVAMTALMGLSSVVPTASAGPCNTASCCALTMCECTLCELHGLLQTSGCGPFVDEANEWVSVVGTPLCGLTVGYCSHVQYVVVDPHGPGRFYCSATDDVALP